MEDSEILALYWARSEQAIAESARKYGAYCRGVARNILADEQDADEAVNDAWLQAWNAIPPNRPACLQAFLGRITRLISLTKARDRGRQKRGGGEIALALDELAECLPGGASAEETVLARELRQTLSRFLTDLPDPEQKVFICRYWYLDSIETISRDFGFSGSKVKSMLHRTRIKLKKYLRKEGLL